MSNFVIKTSKKSVFATARMPYGAYNALRQLALDHEGQIGETAEGFFKADFDSAKTAKEIKTHFDASYAEAHAAYVPKSEREPKKDTTKKSKPSSSKKNGFNFNKVKGATKSEKNKALHAMLVDMGIADSRTPEYQNVWSNRPWAK